MELLFVFVAVCPAILAAKNDFRETGVTWKAFIVNFAGWFYGITFINFLLMYLQGMGDFDFTVLSVQFLVVYMLHSIAIVIIVRIIRNIKGKLMHEPQIMEGSSCDR